MTFKELYRYDQCDTAFLNRRQNDSDIEDVTKGDTNSSVVAA